MSLVEKRKRRIQPYHFDMPTMTLDEKICWCYIVSNLCFVCKRLENWCLRWEPLYLYNLELIWYRVSKYLLSKQVLEPDEDQLLCWQVKICDNIHLLQTHLCMLLFFVKKIIPEPTDIIIEMLNKRYNWSLSNVRMIWWKSQNISLLVAKFLKHEKKLIIQSNADQIFDYIVHEISEYYDWIFHLVDWEMFEFCWQ